MLPQSKPFDPEATRKKILETLKKKNFALTKQRSRLVEAMLGFRRHFNAEDVLAAAKKKGLHAGRATVYRFLSLLRDEGIIVAHEFDETGQVFEFSQHKGHHDHLFCLNCGRILEFADRIIEKRQRKILEKYRFREVYHTHIMFGYCKNCWKAS